MKSKKDFENWLRKQIDFYTPHLFLEKFVIGIEESKTEYLAMTCRYPYLDNDLLYSEKAFNDWKDGKLKQDRILHELCHIITDPLYCKATQVYRNKDEVECEREHLVDLLSNIIQKLVCAS